MQTDSLTAISPLDGRYRKTVAPLADIFSEYGLIRARLLVEIRWFRCLSEEPGIAELPRLSPEAAAFLADLETGFSPADAMRVKQLEDMTNHDVKAVEYYLKERLRESGIADFAGSLEFVHFACTSEDINNLAQALMLRAGLTEVLLPAMLSLTGRLRDMARQQIAIPMLSRTHGQAASPTTMGKELANVALRLERQRQLLQKQELLGKINGAVGNFNAHIAAYPKLDWPEISRTFTESLGLVWNPLTTQVEPRDYMAELLQTVSRFNTILLDFNRDVWGYISLGYFTQKSRPGETGSSTMPHKVNPIDFENSEGNLGMANAVLGHLAEKLPVSRWQRDLSDSTLLRNLGTGLAHSQLAFAACEKGLAKLQLNQEAMAADLDKSWELLAEPIQTIMRREGISEPYEKLKALTRGRQLGRDGIRELIDQLEIPEKVRKELRRLTPGNYIGNAAGADRYLPNLPEQDS